MDTVVQRLNKWSMSAVDGEYFISLYSHIQYLSDKLFSEYQPTSAPPHLDFMMRLRDWLDRANEDDQKTMIRMVPQLFFAGSKEFNALYRSALDGPITRWLIEQLNFNLLDTHINEKIEEAITKTWFCGITDSMQIAMFHHVNNIEGADHRPDWRTLTQFSNSAEVEAFMVNEGYERVVLLEDFVGSGSQMSSAVAFAASLSNSPSILVLPLIVGPVGYRVGNAFSSSYSNVRFESILELSSDAFVFEVPPTSENSLNPTIREMIIRLHPTVRAEANPDEKQKPYGPFGFNPVLPKRGALLVMYTNTPDNTLPIIHHSSASWSPLFQRSSRI
jgi:hypothetical protein